MSITDDKSVQSPAHDGALILPETRQMKFKKAK